MASQTITGDALQLTQDNRHCYAYSGVRGVTDDESTLLLLEETGSYYIHAKIQTNYITATENTIEYLFYFNDIIIQGYNVKGGGIYTEPDNPLILIIPPFTTLKITGTNKSASTSRDHTVTLTGRVYEYLPVRN